MGVLEDLSKFGQGVASEVSNLGHDAQAAVNKATQQTHQLAASGVNSAGQIFGPLADIFGKDPQEFVHNAVTHFRVPLRELLNRVQERTGKVSYTFPTPKGLRKVSAIVPASLAPNGIALVTILAVLDSPATMIEEAGRIAAGLPVKARGLGGFTVFPPAATARGLGMERGVFGVDDVALALLPLLIPILIQIASAVLPGIIAAAGSIVQGITNPGPTPDQQKAAADAANAAKSQQTMITIGVVVGVLLLTGVGVFVAMRHKKKAA